MSIWIGNRNPSAKPMPWWAKSIIGLLSAAFYLWAATAIRSVNEDNRSHAVRISLPLLPGYSWLVDPGENFDPAKAEWKALQSAVAVSDGQVVFIRTHQGDYALRLFDQAMVPERAKYQVIPIRQSGSIHEGVADGDHPVELPDQSIQWSGAQPGRGFLYASENFVYGLENPFQFGGPFASGDLKQFHDTLPPGVHFSPFAWKLNELNGVKFDDQGFLQ